MKKNIWQSNFRFNPTIQKNYFSTVDKLRRPLQILFYFLIALTPACSLVLDRTISWKESVNLLNGENLLIEREVTYGPDWVIRRGEGGVKSQKILFTYKGKKIIWSTDETWPIQYVPLILEVVDGDPVIFMPVDRWAPCYKYNFPPEGVIAFRLNNGEWKESNVSQFNSALRVNLVQSYHELRYTNDFKSKLIGSNEKKVIERYLKAPKQNSTLADIIAHQQHPEDACIKIRPPENKEMDELRQKNADAERSATSIDAELISISDESEAVTREMQNNQIGMSRNIGRYSKKCAGIVSRVEFLEKYAGNDKGYSSGLSGYQLTLESPPNTKVQIDEIGRGQFQFVECDQEYIYVVRRPDKEELIVHRFEHNGSLVDALRIKIPHMGDFSSGGQWGVLWLMESDEKKNLTISIVDFDYATTANMDGTIKRRLSFFVNLENN